MGMDKFSPIVAKHQDLDNPLNRDIIDNNLSLSCEEVKDRVISTSQQIKALQDSEKGNIEDIENSLLLDSNPEDEGEYKILEEEIKMEHYHIHVSKDKSVTPIKEVSNKSSKFWQTPVVSTSSPFTLVSNKNGDDSSEKRA